MSIFYDFVPYMKKSIFFFKISESGYTGVHALTESTEKAIIVNRTFIC